MNIRSAAIPRFEGLKQKISGDADNADLRRAILSALPEAVEQTKQLSAYFRSTSDRETAKKIFDFLKSRITYKADDYRQVIQLPSALLRPGAIVDCKSLSLFTAAILQNLGVPWHFVLASYTESTIPGHIYVVTDSGIIIDVVWGRFNSEKQARYKYKMTNTLNNYGLGSYQPIGRHGRGRQRIKEKAQQLKRFFQEKARQVGTAAKTAVFASGRNLLLIIIKNNLDGMATKMQKVDQGKLRTSWNKVGGNWTALQDAIRKGASKKSRNIGLLKGLSKIAGINGIGDTKNAEFFKKPEVQAAIIALMATIGTAVGTAVGSASGPGAAVTGATGGGAGTVMGKVLIEMADILPSILASMIPQDKGPVEEVIVEPEPGGDDTGGNGGDGTGGPGMKNLLIAGAVIAGIAVVYFATKKKK